MLPLIFFFLLINKVFKIGLEEEEEEETTSEE